MQVISRLSVIHGFSSHGVISRVIWGLLVYRLDFILTVHVNKKLFLEVLTLRFKYLSLCSEQKQIPPSPPTTNETTLIHNKHFLSAIQLLQLLLRNFNSTPTQTFAAPLLWASAFHVFTLRSNVNPPFPFPPSFSSPPSCLRMAFPGHRMATSQSAALSWDNLDPFYCVLLTTLSFPDALPRHFDSGQRTKHRSVCLMAWSQAQCFF